MFLYDYWLISTTLRAMRCDAARARKEWLYFKYNASTNFIESHTIVNLLHKFCDCKSENRHKNKSAQTLKLRDRTCWLNYM